MAPLGPVSIPVPWPALFLLSLLAGAGSSPVAAQPADPGSTLLGILISLRDNSTFSTVVQAVVAANLTGPVSTLADTTGITLFAPANAAFQALGESTVNCLVAQPGLTILTSILEYHVIKGVYNSTTLAEAAPRSLNSVNGKALNFTTEGPSLFVNGVNVSAPDAIQLPGSAVVHGLPSVLVFPGGVAAVQALCSTPVPTNATVQGTRAPSTAGTQMLDRFSKGPIILSFLAFLLLQSLL